MLERLTGNSYYNFPVYAYGDGRRYVHVPRNMARDVADLRWINTECSWAARERGIVLLPVETWDAHWASAPQVGWIWPKEDEQDALTMLAYLGVG